jgi:hypothetical protein
VQSRSRESRVEESRSKNIESMRRLREPSSPTARGHRLRSQQNKERDSWRRTE